MLVLDWIDGIPLREAGPRLDELGLSRRSVGRRLLSGFFEQVLDIGVFNADPHAGNFLVLPDGTLGQVDFGSVGRLHRSQQLALGQLLIAIDHGDPDLLARALIQLAPPAGPIDLDALERALARFLSQRLGPGTLPAADLFRDLLGLLTTFGFTFDPQLAGAFRALITLEGTLRAVDPDLVLVEEAKALATGVGSKMFGPAAMKEALSDDILKLGPILRSLPKRVDRVAAAMERHQWGINVRLLADARDSRYVSRQADRAIVAFMSVGIGLVSALLIDSEGRVAITKGLTLVQAIGYGGLVVATILGLRVLVPIIRDRVV